METAAPPALVLGTMTFADTVAPAEAAEIFWAALDAGVRDIDTANAYVLGRTEELLAPLLRDAPDDVRVATKVGMPHPDAGDNALLSRRAVRMCVEKSLGRLDRERVDLLYLHQPDRSTPIEVTLAEIATLMDEGKIGAFGLSNYSAWMTRDVAQAATAVGMAPPVVGQQLLNLVARRIEDEYTEMSLAHRLDLMVYNPLAGGLLSGRHRRGERPSSGRFGDSRLATMYADRYWTDATFDAIEALTEIAAEAGITLPELAIRWVAHRPAVTHVLIGASNTDHLVANIAAIRKGELSSDVLSACDRVGEVLSGPMPPYHR
jgi:aryl-alcohol dehydrogenase-like predicted oxidoreductase